MLLFQQIEVAVYVLRSHQAAVVARSLHIVEVHLLQVEALRRVAALQAIEEVRQAIAVAPLRQVAALIAVEAAILAVLHVVRTVEVRRIAEALVREEAHLQVAEETREADKGLMI